MCCIDASRKETGWTQSEAGEMEKKDKEKETNQTYTASQTEMSSQTGGKESEQAKVQSVD